MKTGFNKQPGGFSLAEVAIAVAIAAFGIVTILGLLPQGLDMSRKTGTLTAKRAIVEHVLRDLEQTEWSKLVENTQLLFFDDQGLATVTGKTDVTYIASIEVKDLSATLPSVTTPQQYLRKVIVRIADSRDPKFDFTEEKDKNKVTVFNHYVAKGR